MEADSLRLEAFENARVPFMVARLVGARTLWQNPSGDDEIPTCRREFAARFAYVIADTQCFAGLPLDQDARQQLWAERYGGRGLGRNGGGVRVGNLGAVQIKGLGTNCLVGRGTHSSHSYGGLDAPLAINEAIYSHVIGLALPLGAIKVHGLIFTGGKTAWDRNSEPCWGTLLVRQGALRPAHFLPAGRFEPLAKHRDALCSDVSRTRRTAKDLRKQLTARGSTFDDFARSFLAACAQQYAAARALRLAHSTASPSNMALDGRWLDVPMASFLAGGRNYGQAGEFYREPDVAVDTMVELAQTFAKYNDTTVDVAPLIRFYEQQFNACFHVHVGAILGIEPRAIAPHVHSHAWRLIVACLSQAILAQPNISPLQAQPRSDDPVIGLIEALFLSFFDDPRAEELMHKALPRTELPIDALRGAFTHVLRAIYADHSLRTEHGLQLPHFARWLQLRALCRAYGSVFFYLFQIDTEVARLCEHGSPDDVGPHIDACNGVADWVFDRAEGPRIILCVTGSLELAYDAKGQRFELQGEKTSTPEYILCPKSLRERLRQLPSSHFIVCGFDFRPYLDRLTEITGWPALSANPTRGFSRQKPISAFLPGRP